MKLTLRRLTLMAALPLSACERLHTIPVAPETTPVQWLEQRPFWRWGGGDLVITEPSSTVLIFGLALCAVWVALGFWQKRWGSDARRWFAAGFLLWGVQAALAGTHYQAFSYLLRCAGRDLCIAHTWWEVNYYLITVLSMNCLVVGVAYAACSGRARGLLVVYALLSTLSYTALCLAGAIIPRPFWMSFELMVLFTAPNYLLLFVVNAWRYRLRRRAMDLRMMQTWVLLCLATAVYFVYEWGGYADELWQQGIWFNGNDALHVALILWMLFVRFAMMPHVSDDGLRAGHEATTAK